MGSLRADVAGNEKCIISLKESKKIGIWNVRSLYEGKMEHVMQEMRRTDVKLLWLSEVWCMGRGHFRAGDYKMFHSGNYSYKANRVAIICHQEIAAAVMGYNAVSDRISGKTCKYNGNTDLCPKHNSRCRQCERFLQSPAANSRWHAQGGCSDNHGGHEYKSGWVREIVDHRRILGWALEMMLGSTFVLHKTLKILNTCSNQPKRRLYTWSSPDGKTRNQINYIICRNRWSCCIHAARTLPGADCGTDHELLMAELKLRLKIMPRPVFQARNLFSLPLSYSVEGCKQQIQYTRCNEYGSGWDVEWNEEGSGTFGEE